MERSPQKSGFGVNASTPRKDTKANRQADSRQLTHAERAFK